MLLRSVLLKTLRDQRRSLMWWVIGLVALIGVTVLFYPSLSDAPEFDELAEQMPEALLRAFAGGVADFTSPVGFLNSQLFVLMVPLLFLVFALSAGSGAIAGEEEKGTLDLLLSNPVKRRRVVMEKFTAMTVGISVLGLALWLGTAISAKAVGMDIGLGRVAEASLSATLLGLAFGAIALAVGCAFGKRALSIWVTAALGIAAYFLNAMGPIVDGLEEKLSPFYYYLGADPLANGMDLSHAGVLIGLSAVALAVALITFERRDLSI
jgi:ABC-2 type transport system permease protein